jgi:UDP-glucose 4-epimerase
MKKTCLVTGSSGFIGSHVADYLSKKNFSVRLFDKKKSKFKKKNQKSVIGSLKNFYDLDKATKKIDTLFHFAASADLNHSNNKPFEAIQDNIMGTSNILKACIKNKVKKLFSQVLFTQ